jgi:hypothetical protein
LYPSIVISHKLCYSTRVRDSRLLDLPGVTYHRIKVSATETSQTTVWVHQQQYHGVFPTFLIQILAERNTVKREMEEMDELGLSKTLEYGNLDSKQQACKAAANTAYGVTGVLAGYLPMVGKTPSISAAFGAPEDDLRADAVVERTEKARKRRSVQAERVVPISALRTSKAKAKSRALPAGQRMLPF